MMKTRLTTMAALLLLVPLAVSAQDDGDKDDDFGLWTTVEAVKKVDKKLSVGLDAELRTRDNVGELDRWSVGVTASYKLFPWLKASAGYVLIDDHVAEKYTYHDNGNLNKWTPDYWRLRHRVHVSLTGSTDMGNFTLSLRERWQYTYRPEKVVQRWDEDDEEWSDKTVSSKAKNVLRSRLQLSYSKKRCPWEPYASVELYNGWNVQKGRFTVGTEYKLSKQHVLNAFYRYQHIYDRDDEDPNTHIVGVGYTFKF